VVWTVGPIKQSHGTNFDTDAVSRANIPVDCDVRSMNPKFRGRLYGSPNVVAIVLADNLAFVLEIRIDWQKSFTFGKRKTGLKY
jgi:hypothetical protein